VPVYYKLAFYDTLEIEKQSENQRYFGLLKQYIKKLKVSAIKTKNFLVFLLRDYVFLYHLLCLVFAILGLSLHYFYFTFHLTYIVITSPTLQNILKSIWGPKEKILLTFAFFIIVEYIFVVIGFYSFRNDYPNNNCTSMTRCFITSLDQTFKAGGGVGGYMKQAYNWTDDEGELG
jgi:hypothetical protein